MWIDHVFRGEILSIYHLDRFICEKKAIPQTIFWPVLGVAHAHCTSSEGIHHVSREVIFRKDYLKFLGKLKDSKIGRILNYDFSDKFRAFRVDSDDKCWQTKRCANEFILIRFKKIDNWTKSTTNDIAKNLKISWYIRGKLGHHLYPN